jgi:transcriptional regulator of acetoin/glycerol metabolism
MPLQRINATELARLLNSAAQPIYVLDDELTVVFLNRACREWLGATAEGLPGRRCAYHSSPTVAGPDAVAAGLCPPPQVSSGQSVVANVSYRAEDGRLIERRARFLPLGIGPDSVLGIIALVDAADQPPADADDHRMADSAEAGPIALHGHISRFRQEAAARYRADRLIGNGPAMRLARRQVELAVGSRCSVLLVGPPGSGRQHLAAAIHYGSNAALSGASAAGPLIPLDCSLLGADLLDSTIAALARVNARGESPGQCTLLLNRVDELSADVQTELAIILGRRPPALRLLATAAQPLAELARRKKFRDDLAAMLSTIVVELPPLVQRRDDLPLLAQLFLEEANATGLRQIGGFSAAALDRLDAYAWPGNLDELAEVVAQSHRRAAGPEIGVEDLPEKLHLAAQAAAHPRRTEETIVLDEYLARVERELIRRALARAKGNKARAARLLGMTRPRLYRRMVQLGLE